MLLFVLPSNASDAKRFINTYLKNNDHPYILRIPRGNIEDDNVEFNEFLPIGKWSIENRQNYDVTIICYGQNVNMIRIFFDKDIKVRFIDALFIKANGF